jgi:hypothetical protein
MKLLQGQHQEAFTIRKPNRNRKIKYENNSRSNPQVHNA